MRIFFNLLAHRLTSNRDNVADWENRIGDAKNDLF